MTKAAQMRVSALLKERWGDRASIIHQPDGGLMVHLSSDDGQIILMLGDENSPILPIVAGVFPACATLKERT
jgi:hypothetical protein